MKSEELLKRMAELSEIRVHQSSPKWIQHRQSIRNHVKNEKARLFMRWSTIEATMVVGDSPLIKDAHRFLINRSLMDRYEDALRLPDFGGERPVKFGDKTYSPNLLYQAYHLSQWETHTGKNVADQNVIVEFGGGYGAMALLVHRLGFKGHYLIYDFPELTLLQEYYLSHVIDREQLFRYKFSPMINGDFPNHADLIIAIYSLSESSVSIRQRFLSTVKSEGYLIASQFFFFNVDNLDFFQRDIDDSHVVEDSITKTHFYILE